MEVVVAVVQVAAVVVREAQPDRQARELRAEDLAPVRKVDSEHKAAASVHKAELTAARELVVRRAKVAQTCKETRTQQRACKMASLAARRTASQGAATLATVRKIRRIHSAIRPQVAVLKPALIPVCLPAILGTALTAIHKTDRLQVAAQLVPASSDSQTM